GSEVRLRPVMGGVARQCDRDAVSGPLGQARYRHWPQPRGIVPRPFSATGRLGDVGRQRDRRHGDRSRRIPGGAIGLALLLHMPLLAGMAVTAVVTYGLLMFERLGFRPIELIIGAMVSLIGLCYLVEMFIAPV